jgi:hypothetical protein
VATTHRLRGELSRLATFAGLVGIVVGGYGRLGLLGLQRLGLGLSLGLAGCRADGHLILRQSLGGGSWFWAGIELSGFLCFLSLGCG